MVDVIALNEIFQFIIAHGYLIIFIMMVAEGPIATTAAAFASSFGYFNIGIIFVLSILGDIAGDLMIYGIGYYSRNKILKNYNHIFKVKRSWIRNIENHFKKHLGKTMLAFKFTPGTATVGLALAGAGKVKLKKFLMWSVSITFVHAVFYVSLGYFFGLAASSILKYYRATQYILLAFIIILLIIFWISKKLSGLIAKEKL